MKTKYNYSPAFFAMVGALLINSTSVRASDLDDRIVSSAKSSYVFKTYLKDDSIKTKSKHGAVTLTGTVADSSHKVMAQNTVESLPSVISVDNQLKIKGEMPAEHSDGWLVTKVKTSLLFRRHVSGTATEVNAKDGVVILTGETSSMAQKELTTEYAMDVEGVKEVQNNMTVASAPAVPAPETVGEKIDDASITAQVKSTLMAHRSTSAMKTRVITIDGIVTVSGLAKNDAEKTLVSKLINDISGVVSVVNDMTVNPASN